MMNQNNLFLPLNKYLILCFIFSLILSISYAYPIGTSTTNEANDYTYQRKSFYASGRYWVFYSDGTNIVFRTSTDGIIWGASTTARAGTRGSMFDIFFDGIYVAYAYCPNVITSAILYRRGIPNIDGSITWTAEQTAVASVTNHIYSYPSVCIGTDGYAYVFYRHYNTSTYTLRVTKSGNIDGTWGTTSAGFPFDICNVNWHINARGRMIRLNDAKIGIVWIKDFNDTIRARTYSGIGAIFNAETSNPVKGVPQEISVCPNGNNMEIAYRNPIYDYVYRATYFYLNNSISNIVLISNQDKVYSPILAISSTTLNEYVFWIDITSDKLYYYKRQNSSWNQSKHLLLELQDESFTSRQFSAYVQDYNDKIGIQYSALTVSPFSIRFAILDDIIEQEYQPPENQTVETDTWTQELVISTIVIIAAVVAIIFVLVKWLLLD